MRRFTPTCVGNTPPTGTKHRFNVGSPPRAWGILARHHHRRRARAVHPHVRGEYARSLYARRACAGSPPRAWGILSRVDAMADLGTGSPPRAWGIPTWMGRRAANERFTPTCVGNTSPPISCHDVAPVHPHVRGEYAAGFSWAASGIGSPPRAWGIRLPAHKTSWLKRFTPTCVGNTLGVAITLGSRSGSPPRAWGILTCRRNSAAALDGSPPRAWGILITGPDTSEEFRGSPPRAWGIRISIKRSLFGRRGSPPRAWGIPRSRHRSIWS